MLDRLVINENIAYLYDHLKDFDNNKYYEFIKTNRSKVSKGFDLHNELTDIYNKALLANKNIDIETQTELVSDNYDKFKKYLKDNELTDINNIIVMMDLIFDSFKETILNRRHVREIKKGYK